MNQQIITRLTQIRRSLHRIPEVGFDLPKTLSYVHGIIDPLAERMNACGHLAEVFSPSPSAVCLFFDRGTETATAIRTDMDALPVTERSSLSFASTHLGKMHACGHDGHMAMVLVLAELLEQHFCDLDESVLLVFQPAEETVGGARPICESGVLSRFHVRRIFGFHLWPDLPAGVVASREGALLAASNETRVTFTGLSSHIAKCEHGHDSLEAACRYLIRAYEYLGHRRLEEPCLLKYGRMRAGEVCNQIAAKTVLEGSLRTFSIAMRDSCQTDLRAIASKCAEELSCNAEVHYRTGYPPVINDKAIMMQVCQALPYLVVLSEPLLIAEDFSWYQQYVPGVFMLLGTGTGTPLHANTFNFDETILVHGVESYLRLLGISF